MTTEAPRRPLPIPEYFPVEWPDPAMAPLGKLLKDGQRITVDGSRGIARIEG